MRYNERKIKSNAELSTDILGHPHYNKIYNRSKTIKAYIYIIYFSWEKYYWYNSKHSRFKCNKNVGTKQDNTTNWLKFQRSSLFLHNQSLLYVLVLIFFSLCPCSSYFFSFLYPSIFVARVKKIRYSLIYNYVTLSIHKNIYPNNLKSPFWND